jgi:N-(2-amino-2-carboxyethyl)-L-glutamate synthase
MREEGILSVIGNTPLIRLSRVFSDVDFNVYAKLEGLNPGGSTKDRPAFNIIEQGVKSGAIQPGAVVIESTSGNMGIGLAQACSYFGLRLICVVDPKTTIQNIRLLRAFGAEVDLVMEPDPNTGEYLQARLNRVHELLDTVDNSFWPNQYANCLNPAAHHRTMAEIDRQLDGRVDYLFCATSTCGTMRGCSEYIREHSLNTKTVAVDAVGSVIFGGKKSKRLIPGHGAAVRPLLYQEDLADHVVRVTDLDCVVGCRRLVRAEAVLAGGSSGGVIMAIDQMKAAIPSGANCVAILPDRGERYLDSIFSEEWVLEHFGDVSHLWENYLRASKCLVAAY